MVDQNKDIEVLIAAFLKGEASPDEALRLQAFIDESAENKRYFQQMEKLMAVTHSTPVFDESGKAAVWQKIASETEQKKPGKLISLNVKRLFYAAAAMLVIALSTLFLLPKDKNQQMVRHQKIPKNDSIEQALLAANSDTTVNLSDLTTVHLKAGSKLELSPDYNLKKRSLKLKGSAEFHVIHNEKKPFVLSVERLKIVDLGTIFRVVSAADTVKIIVDEGKVELRLNNQLIKMAAGDSAFYVIKTDFISRYDTKKERKNKVFEFDGTSLNEVVAILSEFYEQPIVIKDKANESCKLTVRFSNENLVTILDVIQELMDIKAVKNNHVIELYGKGCND